VLERAREQHRALVPMLGAARGRADWMALARPSARLLFVLVAFAFVCLAYSFASNDFSVLYVASNSNRSLPLHYRITAVWGGHEGSILLWLLMLTFWALAVATFSRHLPDKVMARILAVMGLLSFGFLLFMLATSNPFDRLFPAALEGRDFPAHRGADVVEVVIPCGVEALDGRVVAEAETFNVESGSFTLTPRLVLLPRAFHTTTLLTDGRLLIAGGVGANGVVLDDAEIVDPLNDRVERFNARLETARFNHLAVLLPSAPVLVSGGLGVDNEVVQSSELFDPESRRFSLVDDRNSLSLPQVGAQGAMPFVAAVNPPHGATGVLVDQIISVRFSKPMRVETLDAASVTLFGPTGTVAIDVVPAEAGLLLFATPKEELLPGSSYTLFIRGAVDTAGMNLPFTAVGFQTASIGATAPNGGLVAADVISRPSSPRMPIQSAASTTESATTSTSDPTISKTQPAIAASSTSTAVQTALAPMAEPDEEWIPGAADYETGMWMTNRLIPTSAIELRAKVGLLKSASTASSLAGLVLKLNDKPLPGVTLRIGSRTTRSNGDGTFLIEDIPSGSQTLVIDATSAGPDYGFFETLVDITKGGTTVLPYTIWIPKLDRKNAVRIPSPTLSEVVLTSPKMPGFAVVIPPGVVIRDRAGKIVTELGITPRKIGDEEIVQRLVYALVNEGAKIVDEGIAMRASDIDMVYLTGYGFPLYRGGPMHYADTVGLFNVIRAMHRFAATGRGDPAFWKPAPLLDRLAAEGKTFNS